MFCIEIAFNTKSHFRRKWFNKLKSIIFMFIWFLMERLAPGVYLFNSFLFDEAVKTSLKDLFQITTMGYIGLTF